jgi:DNA-binding Lrp family transcriptional regulator
MAKKPLTDRQQEILAALEGRTVAEASKALGIKPAAVYGHIGRIREAGHKVVLERGRKNGNGSASRAPSLPAMRTTTPPQESGSQNGALNGPLARIDKETDGALEQTRSALDEAKAEREKLVAKLADVDGVIEEHTATLGVLADVSARLHNAPISS